VILLQLDHRLRRLLSMSAVALVCLVLVTARVPAQQREPLQAAAAALGVGKVTTVHLEGFGATYSVAQRPSPREVWPRVTLKKYEADIDYTTPAMRVLLVRELGAIHAKGSGVPPVGEQRVTQFVSGQQIWSTPHGFLKAARLNKATTRAVPHGTEVAFTSGGRRFVGLINANNEVDRVQTWVDDPVVGDTLVETLYRDYDRSAAGVRFPMHITQSQGGYPALDVWVSAVVVNAPVLMPTSDAALDGLTKTAGK
jgi:hypothetical protein